MSTSAAVPAAVTAPPSSASAVPTGPTGSVLSQEEILGATKTAVQGLESLRTEHHQILGGLLDSLATIRREEGEAQYNTIDDKACSIKKSIASIELGIGEAQVLFRLFDSVINGFNDVDDLQLLVLIYYFVVVVAIFVLFTI